MITYILKRITLMIPTFLAISLIVFAIVNFAPGNPGAKQVGAEGGQQANTGEQRESYRIFKEQFNLFSRIQQLELVSWSLFQHFREWLK